MGTGGSCTLPYKKAHASAQLKTKAKPTSMRTANLQPVQRLGSNGLVGGGGL